MSKVVDELIYGCYRYNRQTTPRVTPEQWQACFDVPVEPMEERYQEEIRQKLECWLERAWVAACIPKPSAANRQFEVDRENRAVGE